MDDFEKMLNERFPTGTMDEEVIMNMTFELGDNEGLNESSSTKNAQFANGNAQLRDFFEMVGFICESAMDDLDIQYMPYEQALLYKRDSDFRMNKNTIAYRVIKRQHTDKMGYKTRNTTTLIDNDDLYGVLRYTEYFTSDVEFCFMSMNYDKACDMMDRFEEMMNGYYKVLRGAGIVDYWFEEQVGVDPNIDFREIMIVFVLHYTVKTERNTVITNEGIKKVNVLGKVVHDRSNNKKKEEM
ncbi:MAG: hypothetical protein ACI3T9_02945 [Romboutsia timonensis]